MGLRKSSARDGREKRRVERGKGKRRESIKNGGFERSSGVLTEMLNMSTFYPLL